MYNENEIELTDAELTALRALPREMAPGDLLEERTLRALREEGHFGSPRRQRPSPLMLVLRIAAALALFAGGVATGRYLIAGETRASASTASPQSQTPVTGNSAKQPVSRQSSGTETVVAEREMWM